MNEFERILESISELEEDHAKSLLKLTYARLDIAVNGNGDYTSKNCADDLVKMFRDIPLFIDIQKEQKD
ncbi:hypothetical protein [Metabacillus indicus]|uniref:hypothetical protein n=1 Tax=Metabacillus indicus TaxID=246786 RepID=UPI003CFB2129